MGICCRLSNRTSGSSRPGSRSSTALSSRSGVIPLRHQCVRYRDDPRLIGCFYTHCPAWVHTKPYNTWRGALFDAKDLAAATGRAALSRLATHDYRTLQQAIRRYDPHHLILGDRYETRAPLPEEVVRAALPFVDELSFECVARPAEIRATLQR